MSVTLKTEGPFFDGQFPKVIGDYEDAVVEDVGRHAARMIQEELGSVLRHPTGRYQRSIHVVNNSTGSLVTDGGIVYGPWLEGTGSRNQRSRFKGYTTFRRISQKLQGVASGIAEDTLGAYMGKLQ